MRFPASRAQQGLWFLDMLSPGEPTFHIAYAVSLDGPLDASALQRALDAAVARHAVLRTSIVAFGGVPEQDVADAGPVVTVLDGPCSRGLSKLSRSRPTAPASHSIWPPGR